MTMQDDHNEATEVFEENMRGSEYSGFFSPNEWDVLILAERDRQKSLGYDLANDAAKGPDNLLLFAEEYMRQNKILEAAALVRAARELIQGPDSRRFGELPDDLELGSEA